MDFLCKIYFFYPWPPFADQLNFFNQMFNINNFHIFSCFSCDEVNVIILMVGSYDIISWLFDIIIPPFFILIWIFCKIFFWVPPNSILQISSKFLYKIFNIKQFEFTSVFFLLPSSCNYFNTWGTLSWEWSCYFNLTFWC